MRRQRRKVKHAYKVHVPVMRKEFSVEELVKLCEDQNIPLDQIVHVGFDRATTAPTAAVQPPHVGQILHNLNEVTVETTYIAGRMVYEIRWLHETNSGKFTHSYVQASTLQDAFRKMRAKHPKPIKHKPPVVVEGETIAVRGFSLMGELLMPLTKQEDEYSFEGMVLHADRKPTRENSNGLYSVKLEFLNDLLSSYQIDVFGFVELAGHAIEYEMGYRSERQIIRKLVMRRRASDAFMRLLGDRYQCDVVRETPENVL